MPRIGKGKKALPIDKATDGLFDMGARLHEKEMRQLSQRFAYKHRTNAEVMSSGIMALCPVNPVDNNPITDVVWEMELDGELCQSEPSGIMYIRNRERFDDKKSINQAIYERATRDYHDIMDTHASNQEDLMDILPQHVIDKIEAEKCYPNKIDLAVDPKTRTDLSVKLFDILKLHPLHFHKRPGRAHNPRVEMLEGKPVESFT